ncbi:MAG: hypothetical protein L6Q99_18040 [Planctomycetes bacterium]|nr:hypothetical protein [Planctomycetota bacterium]
MRRVRTLAAVACVLLASSHGSCVVWSGSYGHLWVEIDSPSSSGSHTTDHSSLTVGGDVGGWRVFDPAPKLHWHNHATGESGVVGQTLGTFTFGPLALALGPNPIHVTASNDVQEDASDEILVTRIAP